MKSPFTLLIPLTVLLTAFLVGCKEPEVPVPVNSYEEQYDRYVEHYDADVGPLETWIYDSDDALDEYSVFTYVNNLNTRVQAYSSDKTVDSTTLVSELTYTYDANGNATHGEVWELVDGALTKQGYYDCTYNAAGNYTDYKEYDGNDQIVQHRTCTYDETGEHYLVETYHADAADTDKVQQYTCTYAEDDPTKWVREDHYLKVTAGAIDGTNDTASYERNMIYIYSWIDDNMCEQRDYDEDDTLVMTIKYTFEGDEPATRACLDANGELDLYRTYTYGDDGVLSELRYYNYNNDPGEELEVRETCQYYTRGGEAMYEATMWTYDYSAAVSRGIADRGSDALKGPQEAHHRAD